MEMFDSYHLELDRRLESMWRKQEMMLTKQDQIQSTLHGDTATIQSPSLFTGPGVVTPPFTSPTSSVQTFPPFPAAPAGASMSAPSDVTSMFNCELESLLSLDWSPLPVNLKSAAGPPVSLVEHSGNVARERGPLTDFLTTGKLPPVHAGEDAGFMHLEAAAECYSLCLLKMQDRPRKPLRQDIHCMDFRGKKQLLDHNPLQDNHGIDLLDCI